MTAQDTGAAWSLKGVPEGPLIIGVAGGSGSGKTTVAQHIVDNIGPEQVALLEHDSYYKDQSNLSPQERLSVNYDHPDSLDNALLVRHLQELKAGRAVEVPTYDFKLYSRTPETIRVEPKPVIVVEGILIYVDPRLRKLMNLKIFVDTDADLRFIRRLQRDIVQRGRTVESVVEQYLQTVRLMHLEFVEPSKRYADLIIPEGGYEVPALLNKVFRLVRLMNLDD
ncbi:MAG: uridine kinase [Chloroflexi bacterium 54-19]|nr:MAG: uridine kinase [Chloroflexi bacterium 54-19]